METNELHALLDESEPPYAINTKGGRSYWITSRANVWAPDSCREIICLVPLGIGIMFLRASEIESIQVEHEMDKV